LKYDIPYLANWLNPDAKVLIIGPGGGRDVLAALAFGQKEIIGVELNPIIVDIVREEFRDFAGNVYARPEVEIHVDDGRSFIARSKDKYDIIQASLVDTLAATMSGAFALAENNLYTLESFESYIEHLTDEGMVSFTRWYLPDAPGPTLRLAAIGVEALENTGVRDPRRHVLVVRSDTFGTVILKKTPFSEEQLSQAEEFCRELGFKLVCSPLSSDGTEFEMLFDKESRNTLYNEYPLNVVPPTDDKPFFFQMAKVLNPFKGREQYKSHPHIWKYMGVLWALFVIVTLFAALLLILPLFLYRSLKPRELVRHWKYLGYFVFIGLGFILLEIPLIQQFTLLLGHPIYSLAVVLCSLLFFGSLGSLSTRRVLDDQILSFLTKALCLLALILVVYISLLSSLVHSLMGLGTPLKIFLTLILIAPLGFMMGMPFPLGVRLLSARSQFLIPMCWGLNGGFSVFASIMSIMVAMSYGFSAVMAFGGVAYLLALILLILLRKESGRQGIA
jgi:hypothetical protein